MPNKNEKVKGEITECLSNLQYKVLLPNGYIIRGYLSGKMKMNKIRVVIGDKVEMVAPEYGDIYRITRRI